jgi:hypothetical protein
MVNPHLRQAGLRLLAWPLLSIGGVIWYIVAPPGQYRINFDLTIIVVAFVAFKLMKGDARYRSLAEILCWICLVGGIVLIAAGVFFPKMGIRVSAFIVLFELTKHNAAVALLITLFCFGWPLLALIRAKRAVHNEVASEGIRDK